jgi:predicted dehydrogenase
VPLSAFFDGNADQAIKDRFFPKGIKSFFTLEMLDFLNALRSGGQMETSGEEGLRDLAVCFAALESSLRGRKVRVSDILSGRSARYEREINAYHKI